MLRLDQFKVVFVMLAGLALGWNGCAKAPETDSGALFPIPQGSIYGYINSRGSVVIPPRFEAAAEFFEDRAAVKKGGQWGYIDSRGAQVIPCIYRMANKFDRGVAIVDTGANDTPMAVINAKGETVVGALFRSLSATDGPSGYVLGQKDLATRGFCFYDAYGNCMLGPYDSAFPFSEGRARVRGSQEGLIDSSGRFLEIGSVSLDGLKFSEGMIAIRRDKKLGYMDLTGAIKVEPRYDQGGEFSEGLAAVQTEGHWVFINKTGEIMTEFPAGIAFAYPLSDGLSLVTADVDGGGRKMGYVDRNGKWAIKPAWDDAEPFKNGLALVGIWRGEQVMYIDHAGKAVWRK